VNHEFILDLITARESAATAHAEQLRDQIGTLTAQLSAIETELADLATTRATLLRLAGTDDPPPADATLASTAYQQILAVLTTADSGLRAKDICRALGVDTTANHTESLRAKLKRLVTRGVLTEPEPGLFTLAQPRDQQP
jgi:hypothetical protein